MDKVYGRSIQITAWTQNKEGNLYIKANIKSNGLTFHRGKKYKCKIWQHNKERLIFIMDFFNLLFLSNAVREVKLTLFWVVQLIKDKGWLLRNTCFTINQVDCKIALGLGGGFKYSLTFCLLIISPSCNSCWNIFFYYYRRLYWT